MFQGALRRPIQRDGREDFPEEDSALFPEEDSALQRPLVFGGVRQQERIARAVLDLPAFTNFRMIGMPLRSRARCLRRSACLFASGPGELWAEWPRCRESLLWPLASQERYGGLRREQDPHSVFRG